VKQLDAAKVFGQPIVTQLVPLEAFYPAEDYHQGYMDLHPENMYIVINDYPKVENLRKHYPSLFVEKKVKYLERDKKNGGRISGLRF
jgi:peptide-methionine (S)-S-oxide reductase